MPPPPRRSTETALKYQVVVDDNEYKKGLKLRSGVGWRPTDCQHFGGVRGGSPAKKFLGLRLSGTHFLSLTNIITSNAPYLVVIEPTAGEFLK